MHNLCERLHSNRWFSGRQIQDTLAIAVEQRTLAQCVICQCLPSGDDATLGFVVADSVITTLRARANDDVPVAIVLVALPAFIEPVHGAPRIEDLEVLIDKCSTGFLDL